MSRRNNAAAVDIPAVAGHSSCPSGRHCQEEECKHGRSRRAKRPWRCAHGARSGPLQRGAENQASAAREEQFSAARKQWTSHHGKKAIAGPRELHRSLSPEDSRILERGLGGEAGRGRGRARREAQTSITAASDWRRCLKLREQLALGEAASTYQSPTKPSVRCAEQKQPGKPGALVGAESRTSGQAEVSTAASAGKSNAQCKLFRPERRAQSPTPASWPCGAQG